MKGALGLFISLKDKSEKKEEGGWAWRGLDQRHLNTWGHFLLGDVKHLH